MIGDIVPDARFVRIVKHPDVCSGDARVRDSRIQVWWLETYRRDGVENSSLLENYPELSAEDLADVWAYADAHRLEIDEAIKRQDAE